MSGDAVAYLVGYYPAVSHTFIHREVEALRELGVTVHTMSLRRTPTGDLLTEADREEAAGTWVVLPPALRELLAAHGRAMVTRPRAYAAMLRTAMRTAPGGLRAAIWQGFYVLEAGLVWHRLQREGVRHIHAHFANSASWVAMLAAELGRADGLQWSFTMHGPTEFDDVRGFAVAEKARSAAFVACIGDYCRSQIMKLTPPEVWDQLVIVRCGVDTERFAPGPDTEPRPDGPLRVLCVGRLVPDKGQELLLRAIGMLRDRGISAELALAGDGPSRGHLTRLAQTLSLESSVRLLGSVGQDHIVDLYREADIFCLPSFAEGIPVVLMEAMATGLPVVTSRIMGIPELVEDGVNGLLVPPGRVDALADALEALHDDPVRRQEMGEAGRARVAEEFRVDRSARTLSRRFNGVPVPAPDPAAVGQRG